MSEIGNIGMTATGFWAEMERKYPGEMSLFKAWVEGYKESIGWEKFFNFGPPNYRDNGWHNPKFTDLPPAMQIGIFLQYVCESGCRYGIEIPLLEHPDHFKNIPTIIEQWFWHEQDDARQDHLEAKYGDALSGEYGNPDFE